MFVIRCDVIVLLLTILCGAMGQDNLGTLWTYPETSSWSDQYPQCYLNQQASPIAINSNLLAMDPDGYIDLWSPGKTINLVTQMFPFPMVNAVPQNATVPIYILAGSRPYPMQLERVTLHKPAQHSHEFAPNAVAELQLHFVGPTVASNANPAAENRVSIAHLIEVTDSSQYRRSALDVLVESWVVNPSRSITLTLDHLRSFVPAPTILDYQGTLTYPPCYPTNWYLAVKSIKTLQNVTDLIPSGTARKQKSGVGRSVKLRKLRTRNPVPAFPEFEIITSNAVIDNSSFTFVDLPVEDIKTGYIGAVTVLSVVTAVMIGLAILFSTIEFSKFRKVAPEPEDFSNIQGDNDDHGDDDGEDDNGEEGEEGDA